MKNLKAEMVCVLFGLKPAIKKNVDKNKYQNTINSFKEHYNEIDARIIQEKGILAFHRMFLITGLGLYKTLRDEFQNQDELIEKIHDILWKGPMSKLIRVLAFFIRRSSDPFHRYLQILGPNNEWFFPCPPWEKESVEIQDGIGWHQKKCPYVDFFKNEGVVELTRAYGDMDERIAELLPKHIELRREHAMCKGDEFCDFLYYRKQPNVLARSSGIRYPTSDIRHLSSVFRPMSSALRHPTSDIRPPTSACRVVLSRRSLGEGGSSESDVWGRSSESVAPRRDT